MCATAVAPLLQPMLASLGEVALDSPDFAYEPKYDGIRAIAEIAPAGDGVPSVHLWSRLGNEKTAQFPEAADALRAWARKRSEPVILDGEIVALDAAGDPVGFQNLQGRMHVRDSASTGAARIAFIAFDVIADGGTDLRSTPLAQRRRHLERLLKGVSDPRLRISEQVVGDGRAMHARAKSLGWEGLLAKRLNSVYRSGKRSPDWCKVKLIRTQTCVVAGWTEPRGTRPFFGALLLGVYDPSGQLQYIGHTGAGFSDAELGRVWKRLHALRTKTPPFAVVPKTNERPHWTKPSLPVEVKFTEWTADGRLRHPTYLGVRDDVEARSVRKETMADGDRATATSPRRGAGQRGAGQRAAASSAAPTAARATPAAPGAPAAPAAPLKPRSSRARTTSRPDGAGGASGKSAARTAARTAALSPVAVKALLDRLDEIQDGDGNGVLELPGGGSLEVTNLKKPFWPALRLTKGDLFRHYVRAASSLLPALADRPLVMKRYPNGVAAKPFYQHRAPDKLPAGVRMETVDTDAERRAHLVGGDLLTLLYTAQLASISQDPWFSRIGSLDVVDHVAIDLDPPDGLPFSKVLDVAKWVRDELAALKAVGYPKTSGAGGLHIYIPMPAGTPYEAGLIYCQIVATLVARKHPGQATIERSVAARGKRIYVDYLQNIRGKTLASAYSARANDFAGVSTPLTWAEVEAGVTPQDFTVANFAARLEAVGDLWSGLRRSKGVSLRAVEKSR